MTFNELYEKVNKAALELLCSGLDIRGYGIQIELSINSYRDLLNELERRFAIRTEIDDPNERVHRGTIFGTPFVLTQDTDRVLIAREP